MDIGTQTIDSSSETIQLRFRQEPRIDTPAIETSADELTLRSVDERIKQATDPILRQVEELCALLADRTEMESAGNSEASGSRRNHESISLSRDRHDTRNLLCDKPKDDLLGKFLKFLELLIFFLSLY